MKRSSERPRHPRAHGAVAVALGLLAAGAACKQAAAPTSTGSGSGAPVGSGSSAAPADAASPDASGIGFSTTITPDGVGPITAKTLPATLASLFPGLDATRDIKETAAAKAEHIALAKSGQPILSAVVDHFVNETAISKVVITDAMFATATGIGVTSTIIDLAKKHPDTKCFFEKYDVEADAEQVDRLLFCTTASLPRLSFQLDGQTMQGKPGEVGINVLARQRITQIVWLPGARVTVPTGSLGTITATAVGPITATTPTTVVAIKQLLPSHDVASEVRADAVTVIMVSRGKETPVLEIGLAAKTDKGAPDITILDSGFATAAGTAVGSTVGQLAANEPGVTCAFAATERAGLVCVARSQPTLSFSIVVGNFQGKAGASVPVQQIATRRVAAIRWRAR